jgi:hypothetical protein
VKIVGNQVAAGFLNPQALTTAASPALVQITKPISGLR